MLFKRLNVKIFTVIVSKIVRLIIIIKNKIEEVNLHKLFHVEALEQVKTKLFSEYYDCLNVFNRTITN